MKLQITLPLLSLPFLSSSKPVITDREAPLPGGFPAADGGNPLTVRTRTGTFTAGLAVGYPDVLQFGAIPFAQPPVGDLRWMPPQPLEEDPDTHRYATRLAPSCPQYVTWRRSVWNMQIPDFKIRLPPWQGATSGYMAQSTAEDCLYLAIWAPVRAAVDEDDEVGNEIDEDEAQEVEDILLEEEDYDDADGGGNGEEEGDAGDGVGNDLGTENENPESIAATRKRSPQRPWRKPAIPITDHSTPPPTSMFGGNKRKRLLPVIFFMTGGSFQSGGIDIPYQIPAQWVSRSKRHIVVTINYRVNIFGFPNAGGLDGRSSQNLGILDQRAALEWVRDNIEAFGGDPDHIVMWGHSAGAVAADVHTYAFADDVIAKGIFMQSGSTMRKGFSFETDGFSNFSFVARNLGCAFGRNNHEAELSCMRQVPATLISSFVGRYGDAIYDRNNTDLESIVFRPSPDDVVIWRNWTQRALDGPVSPVPALVSNTANEQSSMHRYPVYNVLGGPNQTAVDAQNVEGFVCVTSNTTRNRGLQALTTYRFQYAGNFSNLTPLWWMGAYHSSDVPLVMGTHDLKGNATRFEQRVSATMQDWIMDFVRDPENGLRRRGWLPFRDPDVEKGGMVMRFAVGDVVQEPINSLEIDRSCWGEAAYDHHPGYSDDSDSGYDSFPDEVAESASDDGKEVGLDLEIPVPDEDPPQDEEISETGREVLVAS